jgi:hypothetical protein
MGPLSLSDGAFDSYVIYFSVIVSSLPLCFEVRVGAPNDCEDCAMGCESSTLLLGFLDLWRGSGNGMASLLTWGLLCIGHVSCGTAGGYVICRAGGGYVICGVCGGCGWLVVA